MEVVWNGSTHLVIPYTVLLLLIWGIFLRFCGLQLIELQRIWSTWWNCSSVASRLSLSNIYLECVVTLTVDLIILKISLVLFQYYINTLCIRSLSQKAESLGILTCNRVRVSLKANILSSVSFFCLSDSIVLLDLLNKLINFNSLHVCIWFHYHVLISGGLIPHNLIWLFEVRAWVDITAPCA